LKCFIEDPFQQDTKIIVRQTTLKTGYGFMDNRRRAMDKCMDKQAAHTLILSPAWRPVTHKLHSHNCDRPPLCSQKMTIKK
jgi:hypothetical protein